MRRRRHPLALCALAAVAAAPSVLSFRPGPAVVTTFARVPPPTVAASPLGTRPPARLWSEAAAPAPRGGSSAGSSAAMDDDEEEEWEYEEYENLTEMDFIGSEWKVGTVWGDKPDTIRETWVRLLVDEDADQNVAVWGDGSRGKWSLDVASQFFSVSKESFGGWLGKKIWAGVCDDYYYLQGTVRGWSPISPASVLGQWQAKRLGVEPEEAGVAPWFETEGGEEEDGEGGAEGGGGGSSEGGDAQA